MANLLRKMFNLYPGEGNPALCFAILAFFWSLSVSSGLVLSDSLFVIHIGSDSLPIVYIQTALIQFLIAYLTISALNKIEFNLVYKGVLFFSALFCLYFACVFYTYLSIPLWYWYALKVFCNISFVILMTSYWNFIDQYYDLQDAKRHYGVFTAAVFLGMGVGGIIVTWLYPKIGVAGLLLIMGFFIFLALLFTKIAANKRTIVPEELQVEGTPSTNQKISYKNLFSIIIRSPFTLIVMTINMLMYLLDMISEFTYFEYLENIFSTSAENLETSDQLTLFLGEIRAWTSLGCIIFSTFIYSRLIKRFGINNIFPVTPILFLLIYITWNLQAGIAIAVITFISLEGVRDLIDTNSFNIHINVVPSKIKKIARICVNSFFEPVGILFSALFLLIPGSNSKIIGLSISLAALIVMFLLRKTYPKAVYSSLSKNDLDLHTHSKKWFYALPKKEQQTKIAYLLSHIERPHFNSYEKAFETFIKLENRTYLPILLKSLNLVSTDIKTRLHSLLGKSVFKTDPLFLKSAIPKEEIPISKIPENPKELIDLLSFKHPISFKIKLFKVLEKVITLSTIAPLIAGSKRFHPIEIYWTEKVILQLGRKVIPLLVELINKKALHSNEKIIIGHVLGYLDNIYLKKNLTAILSEEIERGYFLAYHSYTIQERYPNNDLKMIEEVLEMNVHSIINFIINLIGIAESIDNIKALLCSLRSHNHKIHSNAVEAIEKASDSKLFRLIEPLIDDRPINEKIRIFKKELHKELSLKEILDLLENSPSIVNTMSAKAVQLTLIEKSKLTA